MWEMIIILGIIIIYLAPTLIAINRWVINVSLIAGLNILLWWLGITWLMFIIWASVAETKQDKQIKKLQLEQLQNNQKQNG